MTAVTQRTTTAPPTTRPGPAAARRVLPAPGPASPAALTVTVERVCGVTRLHLEGELEATTAPLLDCLVTDALERRHGDVLLDLTEAGFCDVKGLDCLLTARRRARARGRRLSLRGASPLLQHLLHLTGAADVIGPEA